MGVGDFGSKNFFGDFLLPSFIPTICVTGVVLDLSILLVGLAESQKQFGVSVSLFLGRPTTLSGRQIRA
jgi:hypothetical protein